MNNEFFKKRPDLQLTLYVYETPGVAENKGWLKIGQTTRDANQRISEQVKTAGVEYKILLEESAIKKDGTYLSDHEVHNHLKKKNISYKNEWFQCDLETVQSAIYALKTGKENKEDRFLNFKLRPEQEQAIELTHKYFKDLKVENKDVVPRYLWNAKMRFGKTFASYKLAQKAGYKKILILTFKPAVKAAWEDDLLKHVDFEGWQFIDIINDIDTNTYNWEKPVVAFGSFQDILGKNSDDKKTKKKNEWVHAKHWDLLILDEYHYGAWRDRTQDTIGETDTDSSAQFYDSNIGIPMVPITSDYQLVLSGTPFRALSSGEFDEDAIFNWTYADEQRAKKNWDIKQGPNPYLILPKMVLLTYKMPPEIIATINEGELDGFELNEFFKAEVTNGNAAFIHEAEVQSWLQFIRNQMNVKDMVKQGGNKPILPFNEPNLLHNLLHTFWYLPNVASCEAMYNLLQKPANSFYQDYKIIRAYGHYSGNGAEALRPVREAQTNEEFNTKTITLSCGKLTTGVTVRAWTGIFMLRTLNSPESYFQAAFRVQSPWVIRYQDDDGFQKEQILKEECYVFDFDMNRSLSQIASYSSNIITDKESREETVKEFLNFLPILAYSDGSMSELDAGMVLDIATTGTSSSMLAKAWSNADNVNVDNITLDKLLKDTELVKALADIEAFRSLREDITHVITKAENVKKLIKEKAESESFSKAKNKELTAEENELKTKRKQIREKLLKLATRIPAFMYLSDYREETLKDVIEKLEPELFKKVTGIEVSDFGKLVSLGIFREDKLNDLVYRFKRQEDYSLHYGTYTKHLSPERFTALYNTKI